MTKQDFTYVDGPPSHVTRRREIVAAHPEVQALTGKNAGSALWIAVLVLVQWALAAYAATLPWWLIVLAAMGVGAFINHALYVLIHECTHNLVFQSARANQLAGLACDCALVLPSALAFRKYHLFHHRYFGQYEMDPDIVSHGEARLIGNSAWRKALWVFLLPVSQALRPMKLTRLRGVKLWDPWIRANLVIVVALDLAILAVLGPKALGYLAASTLFALGLHPLGGRWIQEHHVTRAGQETYSYYGPLNRVCFNMGFHNEHHDFPAVPWNRLPAVKRLAPEFYDGLASYRSWIGVLRRFIFDPAMTGWCRIVHPASSQATGE